VLQDSDSLKRNSASPLFPQAYSVPTLISAFHIACHAPAVDPGFPSPPIAAVEDAAI
jgi:hypothetical protein